MPARDLMKSRRSPGQVYNTVVIADLNSWSGMVEMGT